VGGRGNKGKSNKRYQSSFMIAPENPPNNELNHGKGTQKEVAKETYIPAPEVDQVIIGKITRNRCIPDKDKSPQQAEHPTVFSLKRVKISL
jgi:hypothetical protein